MKRCTKCGIEKQEEAFAMQPSRGRRRAECQECKAKSDKEWCLKRKQNPPQRPSGTKKCNQCHEVKSVSQFSPGAPGYFHGKCRACENANRHEKRREQYRNDPTGRFYWPFENEAGIMVKRCTGCHTERPLNDFYTNSADNPKRLHGKCKDCDKAMQRADYEANPEKHRETARNSARKYPDRRRARWNRWVTTNKEHRTRYLFIYKDRRAEVTRIWGKTHPEKRADSAQRRRARMMNASRIERIDRKAIIERDEWTCYLCGETCTPQNVTLDHVIPLVRGGTHTADNLRVACYPCNCKKGVKLLNELPA